MFVAHRTSWRSTSVPSKASRTGTQSTHTATPWTWQTWVSASLMYFVEIPVPPILWQISRILDKKNLISRSPKLRWISRFSGKFVKWFFFVLCRLQHPLMVKTDFATTEICCLVWAFHDTPEVATQRGMMQSVLPHFTQSLYFNWSKSCLFFNLEEPLTLYAITVCCWLLHRLSIISLFVMLVLR